MEHDVGVDGALACGDDAVALLCLVVEVEAVDIAHGGLAAGVMPLDDGGVLLPDGGLHPSHVAVHEPHEGGGTVHVGVQREEGQDGVQDFGNAVAVHADDDGVLTHGGRGEIAVGDAETVAVAHLAEDLQELGGENFGDTFQHGAPLLVLGFKFGFIGVFVLPFSDLPLWGRGTIRRMVDEVRCMGQNILMGQRYYLIRHPPKGGRHLPQRGRSSRFARERKNAPLNPNLNNRIIFTSYYITVPRRLQEEKPNFLSLLHKFSSVFLQNMVNSLDILSSFLYNKGSA